MPTSTLTKFQPLVANLANKKHNLATDQLAWALTNTAPTVGMNALSELTQISYTNCSSRNATTVSSTQTAGAYSLILADLTLTASGGTVATGFELIGWIDYGASVTLASGESLLIDVPPTALLSGS
jgi:hypothetical protein